MEAPPAKLAECKLLEQLCRKTHPAFGGSKPTAGAADQKPGPRAARSGLLLNNRLRGQHHQELFTLGLRDCLQKLVDVVRAKGGLGHDGQDAKEAQSGISGTNRHNVQAGCEVRHLLNTQEDSMKRGKRTEYMCFASNLLPMRSRMPYVCTSGHQEAALKRL